MSYRSYDVSTESESPTMGPGAIPMVIKVMLIANIAIFVVQQFLPQMILWFGLAPDRFLADFPLKTYQLVSYMFLHGSFGHIFFNLFSLFMFGREVELSLGSRRFLWFYLVAGVAGGLLTLAVFPSQYAPMIGASGAIYGVLAAYWLMFPNRMLYLYFLFPVPVKWAIPGMMLLGFLFAGPNVAHMAHLGGAVAGFLWLKFDWRWLYIGKSVRGWFARQPKTRPRSHITEVKRLDNDQQALWAKVDSILDRMNEVGKENLTAEEKKILEDASEKLSRHERDSRD
jgi:membrane associated rhomboid family serine protease